MLNNGSLNQRMELEHGGPIVDVSFSPDNQYLAVADANRLVTLYRLPSYEVYQLEGRTLSLLPS